MLQYRIYCLNEEGGFAKVHEMELPNDAEAMAHARALKHPGVCEVWHRRRLVGIVEAHSTA
jgi:hypothetical protein